MEGEVKGGTVWTASQSTFVQTFLANLVADGSKTSSGFKRVHLNACAKALNEHFKINRTHEQISNHLKTLKKKYIRINQLRSKSGAVWDEENFIIRYDHEMYTSHFKDESGKERNKGDDEYINKPLPYYGNLATIFGDSVATEQFVKTSSEPLAVDVEDDTQKDEMNGTPSSSTIDKDDMAASGNRPSKRAKKDDNGADPLVQAFDHGTQTLASAI
ncbi:hypothetical protein GQ55_8G151300 [Panicum hallii var. hallii]|uniref:Myb/SANT-like domain-containing protein n=1 Tax=Panicum hallii var. hallii TaxID=1504633 RepID=A0A2T7CN86_9POAL|nr:hypothetical protein GQ55_8G151300 [Panicum hallii var. hallii]